MNVSAAEAFPILASDGEVVPGPALSLGSGSTESGDGRLNLPTLEVDPEWAWSVYEPSPSQPWTALSAAHLFRRAGFGASGSELQEVVEKGPRAAIDQLFAEAEAGEASGGVVEASLAAAARSGHAQTYVAWWLRRLLESRSVLRERMSLFWHQHFAIGASASGSLGVFHRHQEILRSGALGGLEPLLASLLNDPAMFAALGGTENRLSQPNLAFARSWLEAFTVGPAVAGEADVRDAARALTGWFVYGGKLRWIGREHDQGPKQVLGTRGALGREDLTQILATHRDTARTVALALWRGWVSETTVPSPALLGPLADRLQQTDGARRAIETILRSQLFFSQHAVAQKIKSPVELLIGLGRCLGMLLPTQSMADVLGRLGQRLDEPPTLRGWASGVHWINSMTLPTRMQVCRALLEGGEGFGKGVPVDSWLGGQQAQDARDIAGRLGELLVPQGLTAEAQGRVVAAAGVTAMDATGLLRLMSCVVGLPEFQLN